MKILKALLAAAAASVVSSAVLAGDIMIHDPYARVSSKSAKSGAAFMAIHNHSLESDVLISVESTVAKKVELHTHKEVEGVMKMIKLEDGIVIPGMGHHALKRGGDHVMFMGLTQSLRHGDDIEVTLIFERGGRVKLKIPVDLERTDKVKHDH
ncbi:MAG: copper chaperone PCu(A)C [Proteobacteria bacterium]|jgi:copper(I)-binding protein|nr:copper chaperone PCu(A)C [Pseudomonadota bacterium]